MVKWVRLDTEQNNRGMQRYSGGFLRKLFGYCYEGKQSRPRGCDDKTDGPNNRKQCLLSPQQIIKIQNPGREDMFMNNTQELNNTQQRIEGCSMPRYS
ncbi:hypothetical protein BaRGS_00039381 [Batillaria attramentaria]|uniref:Uncharacterized protein n=1 Tax=Batillaria attramentaria TaxID=370345 RepID=A0ABD0J363_9CAEN